MSYQYRSVVFKGFHIHNAIWLIVFTFDQHSYQGLGNWIDIKDYLRPPCCYKRSTLNPKVTLGYVEC